MAPSPEPARSVTTLELGRRAALVVVATYAGVLTALLASGVFIVSVVLSSNQVAFRTLGGIASGVLWVIMLG